MIYETYVLVFLKLTKFWPLEKLMCGVFVTFWFNTIWSHLVRLWFFKKWNFKMLLFVRFLVFSKESFTESTQKLFTGSYSYRLLNRNLKENIYKFYNSVDNSTFYSDVYTKISDGRNKGFVIFQYFVFCSEILASIFVKMFR